MNLLDGHDLHETRVDLKSHRIPPLNLPTVGHGLVLTMVVISPTPNARGLP